MPIRVIQVQIPDTCGTPEDRARAMTDALTNVRRGVAPRWPVEVVTDISILHGRVLRTYSQEVPGEIEDGDRARTQAFVDYWAGNKVISAPTTNFTSTMPTSGNGFDRMGRLLVDVDAVNEVGELARGYREAAARAAAEKEAATRAANVRTTASARRAPVVGTLVRVVRGRVVPKGTQGRVVWFGEGQYGLRVGIATSQRRDRNGRHLDVAWTAAKNVDVIPEAAAPAEFAPRDARVAEELEDEARMEETAAWSPEASGEDRDGEPNF